MNFVILYAGSSIGWCSKTWSVGFDLKERLLGKFCRRYVPWWITPNGVTYFRMGLAGVVFHLMSHDMYWGITWGLVALAVISDLVDGPLARVRDMETDWGANIDPIADKMIILVVAYFELIALMPNMYWVIFWAEFASTILRAGSYLSGSKAPANLSGKLKMVLQSIALIPVFFGHDAIAVALFFWSLLLGTISLTLQTRAPLRRIKLKLKGRYN